MTPLLAVFAAFSFIVMMFNLPLPGGTTGHATGVAIAAIVLGPWAAMAAVSIAVAIQALFFGDGGVTAIGANCFNMAIVGSLVAYAIYRLASRCGVAASIAAALAGYVAINVSAFVTAIELGLQPILYRDASGAALYAPYPLHIAIPAMMIGHMTIAGVAEMVLTGGVVAWLERNEPGLLRRSVPDARVSGTQPLWAALAILMVLTPLGILAAGSAWGEWAPADFHDPQMRAQIALASGDSAPPSEAPAGLARLASFWTAPMPRYAPSFLRSAGLGYLLSAMMGAGLIILHLPRDRSHRALRSSGATISFYREDAGRIPERLRICGGGRAHGRAAPLLLQKTGARVKVAGAFALIVAVVALRSLVWIGVVFGVALLLAVVSRISLRRIAGRVWLPVLFFTGAIALPAILLVPNGSRSAAFLIARAETAATCSALLVLSTPWPRVLRALRGFRLSSGRGGDARDDIPLHYFLVLRTAFEMLESRRSRTVGVLAPKERRRLAASSIGVLMSRSFQLSGEVHLAMQSRGFRGEIHRRDERAASVHDGLGGVWGEPRGGLCVSCLRISNRFRTRTKGLPALENVSMTVRPGQHVALLGANVIGEARPCFVFSMLWIFRLRA